MAISAASSAARGERTRTSLRVLDSMSWAVVVSAIRRPRPMTIRRSAVCAISLIRWLETRTVRPSAARRLELLADPADPLGVEAVDRLVEHQDRRVAEQRRGDAQPLLHAEGESPLACGPPRPARSAPAPRRPGGARSRCSARSTADATTRCVRCARRWHPAARRPRAAGGFRGRRPATRAVPDVGRSRPRMTRIVVVLPVLFGPRKPVTCPGRAAKLSPSTAVTAPNRLTRLVDLDHGCFPRSLYGLVHARSRRVSMELSVLSPVRSR